MKTFLTLMMTALPLALTAQTEMTVPPELPETLPPFESEPYLREILDPLSLRETYGVDAKVVEVEGKPLVMVS